MESNTKPEIESEIKVRNEKGGGKKPEKGFAKINIERTEIGI
jgi:hypothetical protein